MRILIDIGHPAHVHLFKILAWRLQEKDHIVLFTCRDREHVVHLLKTYGFVYRNFGKHYKTMQGKLFGLAKHELQMINTARNFEPDLLISHGSTIAAITSFLIRKPHIALEDTFNMEQVRLYMPLTKAVFTGDYPHVSLGKKEIQYPGYHELAYLHPNVFTPDVRVLRNLGVEKGDKYAIVRFVAWNASHDVGHKGLTNDTKINLIERLSSHLKVFISSEADLPREFKPYQIKIKPEDMHSALAYAHLYVGESSTMAAESAVLGTTSLYVNDSQLGYIKDLAGYGLLYSFTESAVDQESLIIKAVELSLDDRLKAASQELRNRMLKYKIDVSAFYAWFIENYPDSERQLRKGSVDFSGFY